MVSLFSKIKSFDIAQKHIDRLISLFPECNFIVTKSKLEIENHIINAEIYFGWIMRDKWFSKAGRLRWIHTPAAGIDYIYCDALKDRDVKLTVSKGIHGIAISEHVFGMALSFGKHLNYCLLNQNKGWLRDEINTLPLLELCGSTICIVGLGQIGFEIAKKAKAFGMNVIGIKNNIDINLEHVDEVYDNTNVDYAISKSDIIVNALPYTSATEKYFNRNLFSVMKPTAVFINIGRGNTVDEEILYEFLKERKIFGAGLDVLIEEPAKSNNPLFKLDNVIITPHSSAWSPNYMDRAVERFIENMERFLNGEKLLFEVDFDKGY